MNSDGGVLRELNYIFKISKFLGPLVLEVDGGIVKALVVRSVLIISANIFLNCFVGCNILINLSYLKDMTIIKIENTFFMLVFLANVFTVAFGTLFHGKKTIKLWNRLLKFDRKSRILNLKHRHSKITIFALLVIPHSINFFLQAYNIYINIGGFKHFFLNAALLITMFQQRFLLLQFIVLLELYKNYFDQLNIILKQSFDCFTVNPVLILKYITGIQNEIWEIVRTTNTIYSPQLLAIFVDNFISLIANLYTLIREAKKDKCYSDQFIHAYLAIENIVSMLILIVPAEHCCTAVSVQQFLCF